MMISKLHDGASFHVLTLDLIGKFLMYGHFPCQRPSILRSEISVAGVIRLVKCLSENFEFGKEEKVTIVLDAGTGTTAVGLAIGAVCFGYFLVLDICLKSFHAVDVFFFMLRGYNVRYFNDLWSFDHLCCNADRLPWKIVAVMLAETIEGYKRREKVLISDFKRICEAQYQGSALNGLDDGIVHWVERICPRR